MIKIRNNPLKGWKIFEETINGVKIIRSGYGGGLDWGVFEDDKGFFRRNYDRSITRLQIERIDNIIFSAHVKLNYVKRGRSAAIFKFDDEDGIHYYDTGMSGIEEILIGLQEGTIPIKNGYFESLWTFKKQGAEIYFHPVVDKH